LINAVRLIPERRVCIPGPPRVSINAAWKCSRAKATATRRSACSGKSAASETRKLAPILVVDVVG
jgi:hypothetical protein